MSKPFSLRLFAGPRAKQHLTEQGLQSSDVKNLLAASGGPKWMALFGLDQYLTQEFFNKNDELAIIGSSAGAMRACCYAQQDPASAIQRFADAYTKTRYDSKPSPKDISDSARALLDHLFGEHGIEEVLNNTYRHIHIVTSRCHGLSASDNSWFQGMGMLKSFALNQLSRRLLSSTFDRVIFHSGSQQLAMTDKFNLKTFHVPLTPANLYEAALASGSIPMVMERIANIEDAPAGTYRDGGIVDYHFDIKAGDGFCLYPHFNTRPRPSWFDKFGGRKMHQAHHDNTLIIAPSEAFVAALPHGKIPDRKDFADMTDSDREKIWIHCQNESHRLAEEFDKLLNTQNWQRVEDLDALG